MRSNEDYYVDLYERHADSRAERRARRRSPREEPSWRRYAHDDDGYYHRKSRRSRPWIYHNSARVVGMTVFLLVLGYELVALRDPLRTSGQRRDLGSRANQNSRIAKLDGPSAAASFQGQSQSRVDAEVKRREAPDLSGSPALSRKPYGESSSQDASADEGSTVSQDTPLDQLADSAADDVGVSGRSEKVASANPKPSAADPQPDSLSDSSRSMSSEQEQRPADSGSDRDRSTDESSQRPKKTRKRRKHRKHKASQETHAGDDSESNADRRPVSSESSSEQESPSQHHSSDLNHDGSAGSAAKSPPRENAGSKEAHRASPGSQENFWNWFQESKETEGKGASSVSCPEEYQRLCQMFYKFVRKYKVRNIFDVSCAVNIPWMPIILRKVGNELWGFKYVCAEPDRTRLDSAKEALGSYSYVEFDDRQWWKSGFPDDVELLFAWDVLAHTAYGRVWSFFVNLRKQDVKYVLVDNYPDLSNDPSPKRSYLNLRKHPFRFPAAKEVVQNVTEPGETAKRQLLFYEAAMLPDNLG